MFAEDDDIMIFKFGDYIFFGCHVILVEIIIQFFMGIFEEWPDRSICCIVNKKSTFQLIYLVKNQHLC